MANAVLDRREEVNGADGTAVNGADGTAVNGADGTAAISRLRPKFAIEVCEELAAQQLYSYIFNPRTWPITYRIPRCMFRLFGAVLGPCIGVNSEL